MTHQEWLIQRARTYWENDENLPLDLFAEMNSAGINVEEAENEFAFNNQQD
jgi:hypothetical protein